MAKQFLHFKFQTKCHCGEEIKLEGKTSQNSFNQIKEFCEKHKNCKKDDRVRCECKKIATYVRNTQFAGNHYFCTTCAKQEKDFNKNDPSYFFWSKINKD